MSNEIQNENLKALKVLYVEDEEITRKAIEVILRRRIGGIYLAANGEEGLSMYKELKPDVVITDIEMPIMSGIEMIDEIRKDSEHIPIVVITAFKDEEHYSEKANYNLVKPLNKQDILDVLQEVADKKSKNA